MTSEWEEDDTAVDVDIRGGKEDGIMTCWVGIKGIWMVDEIGTLAEREITRGIKGEVEGKTTEGWFSKDSLVVFLNLVTKYSIFSNCCIISLLDFKITSFCSHRPCYFYIMYINVWLLNAI